MSCTFDKELLSGYFDGELSAPEKASVESHISSCSGCLRELGEIKSAARLLGSLPRLRAPRSVAEGVSRGIAAAGGARWGDRFGRRLFWSVAAAAAVLVTLNVFRFMPSDVEPTTAPIAMRPPASNEAEKASLEDKDEGLVRSERVAAKAGAKSARLEALQREAEESNVAGNKLDDLARKKVIPGRAPAPAPVVAPKPAPPLPEPAAIAPKDPPKRKAPDTSLAKAEEATRELASRVGAKTEPTPPTEQRLRSRDKAKASKAAPSAPEEKARADRTEAPSDTWAVMAPDAARARVACEGYLAKLGVSYVSVPGEADGKNRTAAAGPIEVRLTDGQWAALRGELEKSALVMAEPSRALADEAASPGKKSEEKKSAVKGGAKQDQESFRRNQARPSAGVPRARKAAAPAADSAPAPTAKATKPQAGAATRGLTQKEGRFGKVAPSRLYILRFRPLSLKRVPSKK